MKQHAAVAAFHQIEAGIPELFGGIRAFAALYDDVTSNMLHLASRRGTYSESPGLLEQRPGDSF